LIDTKKIYIALLHYPVYNKQGEVIASAITNLDLHDLARLCATYGLGGYYVVQPLELQRKLAEKLLWHWREGPGSGYNWTRKEAFERVKVVADLEMVKERVKEKSKSPAKLVATSAKKLGRQISYKQMKNLMDADRGQSWLIIFGTGWGLTREFLEKEVDYVLEPIRGRDEYNHLSVRTAVGIILDRLLGVDREAD